jgi:hypothetical protein
MGLTHCSYRAQWFLCLRYGFPQRVMDNDLSWLGNPIARSQSAPLEISGSTLWYNNLTGETQFRGASRSQTVATRPGWQPIATGDYNNDKQTDILWRDESSAAGNGLGRLEWQLLQNGTTFATVQIKPDIADRNWQVVGLGDVDRSGQTDILWRNVQTGVSGWWLMPALPTNSGLTGKTITTAPLTVLSGPQVLDPNWVAAGTGDYNNDEAVDILWYHRPSGFALWWQMQQGNIIGSSSLSSSIAPNQRIAAVADLNGDRQLDLVLSDRSNGVSDLWTMQSQPSNATINTTNRSVLTNFGMGWQVVGATSMELDASNTIQGTTTIEKGVVFGRSQTIGGNDPTDYYLFGLGAKGIFSASLSGLSADADLRLIADTNGNKQVDAGDVIASQWERGSQAESIRKFLQPGGYFVEVRSYDGVLTNYQLQTAFSITDTDPLKFDLQLNYGKGSDRLDATTKSALVAAESFWESAILYRSAISPYPTLPINIVVEDLNLKNGEPDLLTLAYAGPSIVSDGTRLIVQSGTATINARRLGSLDFNSLKDLFIHEFTHVLGFGTIWEPLEFRNADGSIRKIGYAGDSRSLVNRSTNRYEANSYAGWAYGNQLQAAGLAATTVPTAIPIEPQLFAHWAEDVFQMESLTPVANPVGTKSPISQLTLASLRDLGWQVNMGAADDYSLPTGRAGAVNINFDQFVRMAA